MFAERLAKEKKIAEKEITSKIKLSLEEENKDRLLAMEKELSEKSEKIAGIEQNGRRNCKIATRQTRNERSF